MIHITQGIFDRDLLRPFYRDGYYHSETQRPLPIPNKFKDLLMNKGYKFFDKYGIREIPFTIGRDADEHIEAIAICHSHFDKFDEWIGEAIVIGRIRREISR